MSRRRGRGEVAKRGSLVAVLTADVSRVELFLVFRKELTDPRGSRLLEQHRRRLQGPYCIGSILEVLVGPVDLSCMNLRSILPCMRVPRSTIDKSYPVRNMYRCINILCAIADEVREQVSLQSTPSIDRPVRYMACDTSASTDNDGRHE